MSRLLFAMIEVRCCCTPQKLLGWLPVDRRRVFEGASFRFVTQPRGARLRDGEGGLEVEQLAEERVDLPVATIHIYEPGLEPKRYLALKSEEVPLEQLRKIPGFVDATTAPLIPRGVL